MAKKKDSTPLRACFESMAGVCGGCGGPLTALEAVDNSGAPTIWSGCPACSVFDWGVSPRRQRAAALLVEGGFVAYQHMDRPDEDADPAYASYYKSAQTRGACGVVRDVQVALSRAAAEQGGGS